MHNITNTTISSFLATELSAASGTGMNKTTEQYHDMAVSLKFTYIALMISILFMTVFANAILILLISFHKSLCTTTNIFIANLAFGDILLGSAVIPFDIDKLIRGSFAYNVQICELSSTAFLLSLPASAINLLVMTFERFCAVHYPLQHRTGNMFTKRRIVGILLASWIYITATAMLPIMGWRSLPTQVFNGECMFFFDIEYAVFLLVANFILPLLLIVVMNISILKIARDRLRQRRSTKQSQKLLARSISVTSTSSSNAANNKAAKIIAILVGVFACCWLPYIINTAVNIVCNGCSPREAGLATLTLIYLNSAINPILYGMYKPQIRSILKDIFSSLCRKMHIQRSSERVTERDIEETCF